MNVSLPTIKEPRQRSQDLVLLKSIENSIRAGTLCKSFLDSRIADREFESVFSLVRSFNSPESAFGFFDEVTIDSRKIPMMGSVAEELFDVSKSFPHGNLIPQLREFVLKYFLRISDFRAPESYVGPDRQSPLWFLDPFCFCRKPRDDREGFGFSQIAIKRNHESHPIPVDRSIKFRIPDLRRVGNEIDWILLRVNLFDFALNYRPFGDVLPSLQIPLNEETAVVASAGFITDSHSHDKHRIAQFGFGYSIFPPPRQTGFLAYGPGQFEIGYSEFKFSVFEDGEIRVLRTFMVNRPTKLVSLPLNPIAFAKRVAGPNFESIPSGPEFSVSPLLPAIDMANAATFGALDKSCCISREQIEKNMLLQHFFQNYDMINGAQNTWRRIGDWLNENQLPKWVITGVSS